VPLPEVGGRMPPETDDRDEVSAGPEAELVELGGRVGFRVDDLEGLPAGPDEAGEVLAEADVAGEVPAGADAGPDTLLVGEGGRIGFGDEAPIGSAVVDEAEEVPGGADEAEEPAGDDEADEAPTGTDEAEEAGEADEELTEPDILPAGDEVPTDPYAAVTRVADEEVTVIGQTVVDTAMTMVLTGHSLMPAPQL
jgi:hypothetical protein